MVSRPHPYVRLAHGEKWRIELRMISPNSPVHNSGRILTLTIALFLLLASWGCGGDPDTGNGTKSDDKAQETSGIQLTKSNCSAVIKTGAWDMFSELGRKATSGKSMALEEFETFGSEASMAYWLQSSDEQPIPAERLGLWVELTFWDQLGRTGDKKSGPNERTMAKFYRFDFDNADRINTFITDYSSNQESCKMQELAQKWLAPDNVPQPMVIHFLPGKPELRIYKNHLLVDVGAAVSASPEQLNRQLVSLLYRNYQTINGKNPIEVDGADSVTNALRVFCNEGIASWVGDMPHVFFYSSHPSLGKVDMAPEDIFHSGRQVINLMNSNFAPFIDSESDLQANAQQFVRGMAASQAFTKGGYAMAATIVGHLGEERLVQEKSSVSGFISAYQEAALMNPNPLPVPGRPGVKNNVTMPPFSPEVFDWLMKILANEHF